MTGANLCFDLPEIVPDQLLERPEPQSHLVQFYRPREQWLSQNLAQYVLGGLRAGEGIVLVAAGERSRDLVRRLGALGADPQSAQRDGRLVLVDAYEALATLLVDGQPDWERFDSKLGAVLRAARARAGDAGLRAYGEMVGILWEAGQYAAAVRLEQFWNDLQPPIGFNLFCSYPIDVFDPGFQISAVDALLCAHSHLVPVGGGTTLERALSRAMDELLGTSATGLRALMKANFRPSWGRMPRGEAMILWLRNNLPDHADDILLRARRHYTGAQSPDSGRLRSSGQ
jgi:hypothetical protein